MTTSPRPASPAGFAFAIAGAAMFAFSIGFFIWWLIGLDADDAPGASDPFSWSTATVPVLIDVVLFSVFALHHSLLARLGWRDRMHRALPPGLERSVYVWIASLLFLAVCLAWRPVPGIFWSWGAWWPVAALLQSLGGVLTFLAVRRLDAGDLSGVRQAQGRTGPTPTVHGSGLYGLVRHPIYTAWILVMFSGRVMTGSRLTFAIVTSAYLVAAIPFEERDLIRTAGDSYRAYQRQTKWKLIPFVY